MLIKAILWIEIEIFKNDQLSVKMSAHGLSQAEWIHNFITKPSVAKESVMKIFLELQIFKALLQTEIKIWNFSHFQMS